MSLTNWGKLSKALKSHFIDLHNWSLNINFGELHSIGVLDDVVAMVSATTS